MHYVDPISLIGQMDQFYCLFSVSNTSFFRQIHLLFSTILSIQQIDGQVNSLKKRYIWGSTETIESLENYIFDIKKDVFQYTNYEANRHVLIKLCRLSPICFSLWYCLDGHCLLKNYIGLERQSLIMLTTL